ncbi:MAG: hypothetical protein KatS3mg050_0951 [Litorilinea sp.]|nr:MAG: hypothetical protein KatS3mg050_0951 [Litorilinea sp.]
MTTESVTANIYYQKENVLQRYNQPYFLLNGEEFLFSSLFPHGLSGMRILDLGCGGGRIAYFLARQGAEVIALDLSFPLLQIARARQNLLPLVQGDAAQLCFAPQTFDMVICAYNGLDYVFPKSQRVAALHSIFSILKPGGYFVFSSHNFGGISFGLVRFIFKPRSLVKAFLFALGHLVRGNLLQADCYIPDLIDGLLTYYAWPKTVLSDCREAGFHLKVICPNPRMLATIQKLSATDFLTRLIDPWPYYVCIRPDDLSQST